MLTEICHCDSNIVKSCYWNWLLIFAEIVFWKWQIAFKSICDGSIDTTTASGELIFNIFSSLAQFERKLIQERTKAGLKAARARGKKGGRNPILSSDPKVQTAKYMHKDHGMSIEKICKTLKISRATFYRYVAIP